MSMAQLFQAERLQYELAPTLRIIARSTFFRGVTIVKLPREMPLRGALMLDLVARTLETRLWLSMKMMLKTTSRWSLTARNHQIIYVEGLLEELGPYKKSKRLRRLNWKESRRKKPRSRSSELILLSVKDVQRLMQIREGKSWVLLIKFTQSLHSSRERVKKQNRLVDLMQVLKLNKWLLSNQMRRKIVIVTQFQSSCASIRSSGETSLPNIRTLGIRLKLLYSPPSIKKARP